MDGNFGSTPITQSITPTASSSSTRSHQQGGSTKASTELEEDSESESSSSVAAVLENFREEWKAELKQPKPKKSSPHGKKEGTKKQLSLSTASLSPLTIGEDTEEEAKRHFLMGVTLERQGDLYEAVRCYRRAIQMVPDIEGRVSLSEMSSSNDLLESQNNSDDEFEGDDFQKVDDVLDESEPLTKRILRAIEANGWEYFQRTRADSKIHVGDIPVEIITYILRWVISNDLDVRSLDVLSGVSRGFYCLCRDEQLWKMSCEKVWGSSLNLLGPGPGYSTYREMFLTRTRVRLDGCYISKVSYVRPGEHSFQDQSYRPWHFVEYFRYLRFFPDGSLYFLTTADPPSAVIGMLREKPPRNAAIMKGSYRLLGDKEKRVHCTVVKTNPYIATPTRHGGRNANNTPEKTEFHMYFQIQDMKGRFNWMLRWTYYAVYICNSSGPRGQGNNNNTSGGLTLYDDFDINPTKFPPLYFSRVKSFTVKSESVLE